MNKSIFVAVLPVIAALLGVALSEFFGRWKRREQFKGTLFNKKIEVYASLVGYTADMLTDLVVNKTDKALADRLTKKSFDLMAFFNANRIFLTPEVRKLAGEIWSIAAVKEKMPLDKAIVEMGDLHNALCERCQKELGLKKLEKDLIGVS